jgi:hypothetical protein
MAYYEDVTRHVEALVETIIAAKKKSEGNSVKQNNPIEGTFSGDLGGQRTADSGQRTAVSSEQIERMVKAKPRKKTAQGPELTEDELEQIRQYRGQQEPRRAHSK